MRSLPSLNHAIQSHFGDVVVFGSFHDRSRIEKVNGGHAQFARHVIHLSSQETERKYWATRSNLHLRRTLVRWLCTARLITPELMGKWLIQGLKTTWIRPIITWTGLAAQRRSTRRRPKAPKPKSWTPLDSTPRGFKGCRESRKSSGTNLRVGKGGKNWGRWKKASVDVRTELERKKSLNERRRNQGNQEGGKKMKARKAGNAVS